MPKKDVAHLGDAADRVEHLEGGGQLARGVHRDLHAPAGARRDALRHALAGVSGCGTELSIVGRWR